MGQSPPKDTVEMMYPIQKRHLNQGGSASGKDVLGTDRVCKLILEPGEFVWLFICSSPGLFLTVCPTENHERVWDIRPE